MVVSSIRDGWIILAQGLGYRQDIEAHWLSNATETAVVDKPAEEEDHGHHGHDGHAH
jgi:hypothetical protein